MGLTEVQIGEARLIHGDPREVVPTLGHFDAVIMDPPYSSGARRDADRQVRGSMLPSLDDEEWFSHDAMTTWGFTWFLRSVLVVLRDHLAAHAHLYVFTDWRQTPNVYGMLESCGYRVNHCLVWAKPHLGMGTYWRNQHEHIVFASWGTPAPMVDRGMGSVLRYAGVAPHLRIHPTQKPVALLQAILEAIPAETILDPFMGSASTGEACVRTGRAFVGIEVGKEEFAVACARMEAVQRQLVLFPPRRGRYRAEQLALEVS